MKSRLLLLFVLMFLLTGCGLFKKKSKVVDKIQQTEKVESSIVESLKDVKSQNEVKETLQQKDLDDQMVLLADSIEIRADGSISAKGNAKYDKKTKAKESLQESINKNESTNTEQRKEVVESKENKLKIENKEVVETPSGKGLIYGAIAFLIVVIGLLYYFGIKQKK